MKKLRKGLSVLLTLTMLFGCFAFSLSANAAEIVDSGTCGENLTWTLDDEGLLTISGTGEMTNNTFSYAPWYAIRNSIKTVDIEDGVTYIYGGFQECTNLKTVTVPESLTKIGYLAFSNCPSLTDVYYGGTKRLWDRIVSSHSSHKKIVRHLQKHHISKSSLNCI